MQDLELDLASIKDVETRDNTMDLGNPILGIDDLPFEGIFVIVIEREIARQSVPHKRVTIGKDDLDVILFSLQPLLLKDDLLPQI